MKIRWPFELYKGRSFIRSKFSHFLGFIKFTVKIEFFFKNCVLHSNTLKMSRTFKILSLNVVICVYFLVTVNSQNCSRQRRDAEENEHHLLNILKFHEIIPDIIDDASHADTLEVMCIHSNFLFNWNAFDNYIFSSPSFLD